MANLALAVCYALTAGLTLWLGRVFGMEIPLRPEAGLAFVGFLRWGAWLLPGVMAGALVSAVPGLPAGFWPPGHQALFSAIPAAASTLQALAGAWMVQRWVGARPSLSKPREIILFLGMAGPLSCVIGATVGVTTLVLGGVLSWQEAINAALLRWVGDSMGVIVFAPLLLMAVPSQAAIWHGRRWLVALPSLLLTSAIVGIVLLDGNVQHRQIVSSLDRVTDRAASVLQMRLTWQEGALYAVRGFFMTSRQITSTEFRTFARSILERPEGLVALSWNPLVTREERPAFERRLQEIYADSRLRICERRNGTLQPARAYASHVVVEKIEPFDRHQAALGYDIQSDPTRALALRQAMEDGSVKATAAIKLVQGNHKKLGLLMVLPVFNQPGSLLTVADRARALRGFVVGVLQVEDLFTTTFSDPIWQELNLHLNDVTTPGEPMAIASSPGSQRTPALGTMGLSAVSSQTQGLVSRRRFMQAGRLWELEVHPNPVYFLRRSTTRAPVLLVGGLSLVAVLEAFLLLITGIALESRRDLESRLRLSLRTAGLAHEIKQPLSALLLQSRKVSKLVSDQSHGQQIPELVEAVRGITENCRMVSQSITAIQQLLSYRATDPVELDLVDLVHNALLIVKSDALAHGIHLQSCGLDQPQVVRGDAAQLQLIVLNLLRNSLEATPSGGVVEIGLEMNRGVLALRVADSGPGFAPNPRDPDQFMLSSLKPGGFGLGLYMVRTAAENHGATISFGHSRLGGAEVVVSFPARMLRTS